MITQFNSIFLLRRDNEFNYEKIKNTFTPLNGEVILVDTPSKGLRVKVGDGEKKYKDLPFVSFNSDTSQVISGYFINGIFYEDMEHTTIIEMQESKIYIDKPSSKVYVSNNSTYVPIVGQVPTASAEVSGILKLYQNTGQNTDGTMSQKAISDELSFVSEEINSIKKPSVKGEEELLLFI